MRRHRHMLSAGVLAFALTSTSFRLGAQDALRSLRINVDVGLGSTSGGGSPRDIPATFDFGVMVATPLHLKLSQRLVAAVGVHAHWPLDYGTSCIIRPPDTRCTPAYPKFKSFALQVGREIGPRSSAGETRVLVGPTVLQTDEKSTLVGIQGRVDVTALQIKRIGIRLWTQGAAAPLRRRGNYVLLSGGLSLRI